MFPIGGSEELSQRFLFLLVALLTPLCCDPSPIVEVTIVHQNLNIVVFILFDLQIIILIVVVGGTIDGNAI